jgi:hypothetical protein
VQVIWHEAVRQDCEALLTRGVQQLLQCGRDPALPDEDARPVSGATRYEISISSAIGESRETFRTRRHA